MSELQDNQFQDSQLPATFNRLAWSNLAAQSAEQIALAAAPIVAVLLLGVGEGQTGLLQTALTLPFILFAIPAGLLADRISRRWLMAGAEALRAAALLAILAADLARPADVAAARAARLRRGLRNGRLQRGRTRIGAVAGVAETAAGRQCADRTGAHHRLCRRTGAGRRAGGMGRCCAGIRICRRHSRSSRWCCCRGIYEPAREAAPRRHPMQEIKEGAAFVLHHPLLRPVFITQFIFNTASFVILAVFVPYAVRQLGLSASGVGTTLGDVRRRHGGWRACWRRG